MKPFEEAKQEFSNILYGQLGTRVYPTVMEKLTALLEAHTKQVMDLCYAEIIKSAKICIKNEMTLSEFLETIKPE